MAITHSVVKAPGETLRAVLDWNADHVGTATPTLHGNEAHSVVFISGADVPANETDPVFTAWDKDHADLSNVTSDQHHAKQHAIDAAADHTSGATPGQNLKADANGLPVDGTDTDANVHDAVSKKHDQQHSITAAADHTSGATPGQVLKADGNGLPVDATNTDGEVSNAVTKTHDRSHAITSSSDHTSGATPAQILKADANGLPVDASNTDAQVSNAVTKTHDRSHAITSNSDHTSGATAGQNLKADANGLPVDGSDTDANVHDAVTKKHSQNTDTALGSGCVAADHGAAATDMVINVCYGTGSPPAANTTTIGTLFIKYTA